MEGRWPEVHKTYPQKYKNKNITIDAVVQVQSKKGSAVAGTGKRESCQETEIKNEVELNNKFEIAGLFI